MCHVSSTLEVCSVALVPAVLKNRRAVARWVKQTPALTSTQEAPDPGRKLQAPLHSPSFAGSTWPVSEAGRGLSAGMCGADICYPSRWSRRRKKQMHLLWQSLMKTTEGKSQRRNINISMACECGRGIFSSHPIIFLDNKEAKVLSTTHPALSQCATKWNHVEITIIK